MEMLDKVEIVRQKTGVSYEDARDALVECGYDVLDAIVLLEQQGKTQSETAHHTTTSQSAALSDEMARAQQEYKQSSKKTKASEVIDRVVELLKQLCTRGLEVSFVVERNNSQILSLPVLILVALIVFLFPAAVPLLVVGLFFGFKYHFDGLKNTTVSINDAMGKVADQAESFKNDMLNDDK